MNEIEGRASVLSGVGRVCIRTWLLGGVWERARAMREQRNGTVS